MDYLVGVEVAQASQDLFCVKLDCLFRKFFALVILIDELDAPTGHELQIDAELVADDLATYVFHDIVMVQLSVDFYLVL